MQMRYGTNEQKKKIIIILGQVVSQRRNKISCRDAAMKNVPQIARKVAGGLMHFEIVVSMRFVPPL